MSGERYPLPAESARELDATQDLETTVGSAGLELEDTARLDVSDIDFDKEEKERKYRQPKKKTRSFAAFYGDGVWSEDYDLDGFVPERVVEQTISVSESPADNEGMECFVDKYDDGIDGIPVPIPKEISFKSVIKEKVKGKGKKGVVEQSIRGFTLSLDKVIGQGAIGAVIAAKTAGEFSEKKTYEEGVEILRVPGSEVPKDAVDVAVKLVYVSGDDSDDHNKIQRFIREAALYTALNTDEDRLPELAKIMKVRYQGGRPTESVEKLPKCIGISQVHYYEDGTLFAIAFEDVPGYSLNEYSIPAWPGEIKGPIVSKKEKGVYGPENEVFSKFPDRDKEKALQAVKEMAAQANYEKRSLDATEAMDVMTSVASGLSEMHKRGIVNRDVKLGNIVNDPSNPEKARIVDLGIGKDLYAEMVDEMKERITDSDVARLRQDHHNTRLTGKPGLGTPRYMDYAAWSGEPDEISDVHALCLSMAEAISAVEGYNERGGIYRVAMRIANNDYVKWVDEASCQRNFPSRAERDLIRLCKEGTKPRFPAAMQDIRRMVLTSGPKVERVGPAPIKTHEREYTQEEFDRLVDVGIASVKVRDGYHDEKGVWHDPAEFYEIESGDMPGSVHVKKDKVTGEKTYKHVVLEEEQKKPLTLTLAELERLGRFAGKRDGKLSPDDEKVFVLVKQKMKDESKKIYPISSEEQAMLIAFFHQERLQKYMPVDIEQNGMIAIEKRLKKIKEARNRELGIYKTKDVFDRLLEKAEHLGEIEALPAEDEEEERIIKEAEKAAKDAAG